MRPIFFARLLRARLAETLGQQVVVEQRPGAAGVIGAEVAAKPLPDGDTLWVGQASNLAVNQHLMAKLPYDPVKDFAPNGAEIKERLAGRGAIVATNTPEQFAAHIKSEIANWSRIVKASGARLD